LFIGLLVYILASLGCAFVTDIDTFIGTIHTSRGRLCHYGSRYRHGSGFVAVKEIQSTFFIDVGRRGFHQCWHLLL
jgi:hypothetical protein